MGCARAAPCGATWQNPRVKITHSILIGAALLALSGCAHSIPPAQFHDLWNYDDPAATEALFRDRLPSVEDEGLDAELQLWTQIARSQGLQGRFDDARTTLKTVRERLTPAPSTAHVRWFLERGRVNNSGGDPAGARPDFEAAWRMAQVLELDGLAVDAAHMIAIVAPEEGLTWNERAIALATSSEDPDARRWLGSLHNNIGWTHHDAGSFERALEHFEAALIARREAGQAPRVFVARWCVARAKRSLGRLEEALTEQQGLAADRSAAGAPEDGYVSEELGELLLALERPDEAAPHFAQAAAALGADPWFVEHEAERLERLRRLGSEAGDHATAPRGHDAE